MGILKSSMSLRIDLVGGESRLLASLMGSSSGEGGSSSSNNTIITNTVYCSIYQDRNNKMIIEYPTYRTQVSLSSISKMTYIPVLFIFSWVR